MEMILCGGKHQAIKMLSRISNMLNLAYTDNEVIEYIQLDIQWVANA